MTAVVVVVETVEVTVVKVMAVEIRVVGGAGIVQEVEWRMIYLAESGWLLVEVMMVHVGGGRLSGL